MELLARRKAAKSFFFRTMKSSGDLAGIGWRQDSSLGFDYTKRLLPPSGNLSNDIGVDPGSTRIHDSSLHPAAQPQAVWRR